MRNSCVTVQLVILVGTLGCAEPEPPVTVEDFLANPRLLDATMVVCSENRSLLKYEAECVAAREASGRLHAAAERQRREEFERQSEQKRMAHRESQAAMDAIRQQEEEAAKRREELEYLSNFQVPPEDAGNTADDGAAAPQQ